MANQSGRVPLAAPRITARARSQRDAARSQHERRSRAGHAARLGAGGSCPDAGPLGRAQTSSARRARAFGARASGGGEARTWASSAGLRNCARPREPASGHPPAPRPRSPSTRWLRSCERIQELQLHPFAL